MIPAHWIARLYYVGPTATEAVERYKMVLSTTQMTAAEAAAFKAFWDYIIKPTPGESQGTCEVTSLADNANAKVRVTSYNENSGDAYKKLINDIVTCETAMATAETNVDAANDSPSGGILTWSTALDVEIGTP